MFLLRTNINCQDNSFVLAGNRLVAEYDLRPVFQQKQSLPGSFLASKALATLNQWFAVEFKVCRLRRLSDQEFFGGGMHGPFPTWRLMVLDQLRAYDRFSSRLCIQIDLSIRLLGSLRLTT